MEKIVFESVPNPKVILYAQSDLTLKGTDDLELVIKTANPEAVEVTQEENTFQIKSAEVCSVRVPRQADVEIEDAHGTIILKALDGKLSIESVFGNLTLRSVGATTIEKLRGNLEVKNVMGSLTAELIEGNASLYDVQGDCKLTAVRGNLQISDLDGGLEAQVHGNASLSVDPVPGKDYVLTAHGNLTCSLPEDASVEIEIERAGRITLQIPGYEAKRLIQAPYQLTLGEADAYMKLAAGGNLLIAGRVPRVEFPEVSIDLEREFEGMADAIDQQITQQIQAQLEMIEQQIQTQLDNMTLRMGAAGLSPEQIERIKQRARQASERAAARAQEKIRQAQERLERRMAAAQQRVEQKARMAEARAHQRERHGFRPFMGSPWTTPSRPAAPAEPEPVSDEERLIILRMLEQKKITLEEADRLLSALEGGEI